MKILELFFIFLVCLVSCDDDICSTGKYDTIFFVDASCSISSAEFDQAREFLYDLSGFMNIKSSRARVGVVQFCCDQREEYSLTLDQGDDRDYVEEVFSDGNSNTLTQISSCCCTDFQSGLDFTYEKLWNDREDVEKLVIMLTDGATTSSHVLDVESAARLKAKGVLIFGIGVGLTSETAKLQTQELCSEDDYFYDVENFDSLKEITKDIATHFPCGVNPFVSILILVPLLGVTSCCCLLCLALLGGIALCFLFALPKVKPPVLGGAGGGGAAAIPMKGGETTESMYYVGGQQRAVNWGDDGMNFDTAYRPGDMGMGQGFGKNVGANVDPNKERLLQKGIHSNDDQNPQEIKKKKKLCTIL